jgi:hypothetical protein
MMPDEETRYIALWQQWLDTATIDQRLGIPRGTVASRFWRVDPGLILMGVGGSRRQGRLFISLRSLLPDVEDAMHVFQAAKNGVGFLITADHRTLIRFSADIERLCGVIVLSPVAFEQPMAQAMPSKGNDGS